MIHDLEIVQGAQFEAQVQYLLASCVPWVARALQDGTLRLLKGEIRSRSFLGDHRTIFGDLGGIIAIDETGRQRFLVQEVYAALHDPRCRDARSRKTVDAMVNSLEAGAFTPNITIARAALALTGDNDPIVVDGNKSATAFHYVYSASNPIALGVFVAEGIA